MIGTTCYFCLFLYHGYRNKGRNIYTRRNFNLTKDESQAEKIAWEVHNKGKCAVLEGSFNEMEIYRKILKQEGLTVSVD